MPDLASKVSLSQSGNPSRTNPHGQISRTNLTDKFSFRVDQLLLLGGSFDHNNSIRPLFWHCKKVVNFCSWSDGATWYSGGIGRWGLNDENLAAPGTGASVHNIRVPNVYHSLNELEDEIGPVGENWKRPEMLSGGTFWLSPKMLEDYYRNYFENSGDGKLSETFEGASTKDDKPMEHAVPVRR